MTKSEFQTAYLQAQNGLGNNLQSLMVLTTQIQQLVQAIARDYANLDQAVQQYLLEEEDQE
jgi:hypothetical protein